MSKLRFTALAAVAATLLALPAAGLAVVKNDRDRDRLDDRWEQRYGFSTRFKSARADSDHEGLINLSEFLVGASPRDRDSDDDGVTDAGEDRDGDGLINMDEQKLGTSLVLADTDGDGTTDAQEALAAGEDDTDCEDAEDDEGEADDEEDEDEEGGEDEDEAGDEDC